MNKFYITTPIYYVNSKPHIGHAYTTLVADILARYQRFCLGENEVYFLTGTDEHGAKIAQAAEKDGQSPQAYVDAVSSEFKKAWQSLNISNNDFIRTTDERHEKIVSEVLTKLKDAKTPLGREVIYKGSYEGLYCVGCEAYKKEADLIEGKCPDHNKEPEFLREENWYLRLSDYTDELKNKITADEIKILPLERKNEVLGFLSGGLEDVAISRQQVKWGIKLPFDPEQTTYVWIDALLNYISALGYPDDEKFKKFWPAEVQLLGKDILKFHCLIWPAMLSALSLPAPKELFVHGYFTIDGQKMSKTLGNVIDPLDLISEYGVDASRYLIVSQFPFGQDGNVNLIEFKIKYNADLANGLGNLVSRTFGMLEKYFSGVVPSAQYDADLDLKEVWQTLEENYHDYKIFENLKEIWRVITWCDVYIAENKPWELAKSGEQEKLAQVIYNALEIIRQIGLMILPYLPETSTKILAYCGENKPEVSALARMIKTGQKLDKIEGLFMRKE